MAGENLIFPYFHPTTLVVLDDDVTFLESFVFRHGEAMLCRPFDRAEAALAHIRAALPDPPRPARCLTSQTDDDGSEDWTPANRTITVRPALIQALVHDPRRFEEVSVVIVDYDMPDMDGITFCRQLSNLPVRRVMLTGKADEKIALAAFNERLIDGFLIKHEAQVTEKIFKTVDQLKNAYFSNITAPITRMLTLSGGTPLGNLEFENHFVSVLKNESVVEYYLSSHPPGFFLVRDDGSCAFLLVQDEDSLCYHEEMARDCGTAPRALLQELGMRDRQPWFPTAHGYYDVSCLVWDRYLFPAEMVAGWWCSLITHIDTLGMPEQVSFSCAAYREALAASIEASN